MVKNQKVHIVSIMWGSYLPPFIEASKKSAHVDLTIFSQKDILNDSDLLEDFFKASKKADAVLFYWTHDAFFEEIRTRADEINSEAAILTISHDPVNWGLCATVSPSDCARAYGYLAEGGVQNYQRLLEFTAHFVHPDIEVKEPVPMPWQGILHAPDRQVYDSVQEYTSTYPFTGESTVGLLFSRHSFINGDSVLEEALIKAFENRGFNVLPVFCNGTPDPEAGSLGPLKSIENYFFDSRGKPLIQAMVNLHYFFLAREKQDDISETGVAAGTVSMFKKLNIPVFKPVLSHSMTVSEWENEPQGLTREVCFGIAMPEFEGNIEPVVVAASRKETDEKTGTEYEIREVIPERVEYITQRIAGFVRLARKPTSERKVVFVFHKNECAGLEANVGGAAGLDSGESVVRIMNAMAENGYKIEDCPGTGEDLMQLILERKAVAEFRWTTVDEIIHKKGHLSLLDNETYSRWFEDLPAKAKEQMIKGWGQPPGQEMNGVPPSMVHEGKLVITGLNFGHVNVIMQPKRGCAGARCDGQVCRILHEPDIPPPHQYIATYKYMEKVFKADAIIHVGTHGNLEWLPGKGAGLSGACWPEISIGTMPHLYIYNSDNPAEGVVAKRRSYAVTVNHLQAMLTTSDTYEGLKDLEDLLNEYRQAEKADPARAHQLEHQIRDAVEANHLQDEVPTAEPDNFSETVRRCHEIISSVKNSQTVAGMHTFGDIPDEENFCEYINTILRFDTSNRLNTRKLVFDFWGEDIFDALENPGGTGRSGDSYSDLLYESDRKAIRVIQGIVQKLPYKTVLENEFGNSPDPQLNERFRDFCDLVLEVAGRLSASKEIDSLLNALDGGHVPAGPSGFISRGRYDILPTGRNLYNVDPTRIPTKAAWQVGVKLADALIDRYKTEEGEYPDSVGMVWFASDIMRSDGEQIGQILHLLGVKPRWKANGQVNGFDIIPTQELGRPRIDVNIRVSGITRDCFPDAVRYVDEAISAVALLNEDHQSNFIRRHVLEQAEEQGVDAEDQNEFRRLSFRVFCAQPGVYKAGVNLAVYASAWKTEADLAEVYLYWNGYAYGSGKEAFGVKAHPELARNLKRVRVTFDKHISDETDFLKCCGFYGNYGGMTVAAKAVSGKQPRTYYGDSRDPANISVTDFADELRRVVRAKLLNPKYIQGMKDHGYKGAGDLNKRIGRVYGFGATTGQVDDWIFDEIAKTFMLDEKMKEWFEKVNPWAMEEIGRRLLEAESRDIWNPDPEVLEQLKEAYLDTEACLEGRMGDVTGDFQGGSVDIMTDEDVESWKDKLKEVKGIVRETGKS